MIVAIGFALSMAACGNANKQHKEDSSKTEMGQMGHDDHSMHNEKMDHANHQAPMLSTNLSKEQAQKILTTYIKIKNALVLADGSQAKKTADQLLAELEGNTDELAEEIRTDCRHLSGTADVEYQRMHFNSLSEVVYAMVKTTHANEATIYRMYCPMAFNNKGAYWLSAEKEVKNPYFGDKMMHCGSITEEL